VPRKSVPELLVDEVLNPFYIFQVFSVILWFWDGYQKYACCILFISVASVVENLYETITNINSIRKMAGYECEIEVRRTNVTQITDKTISSGELVPGDVIVVPDDCLMPCDLLLLTGSCIVNESMLTGESVPVIKNCISPVEELYDPSDFDASKKHTLFSGTKVIQSRSVGAQKVYALVIRTGFVTTKGALVRDILYPRKTKFKFYQDSLVFVGAMALVGVGGFLMTLPSLIRQGTDFENIIDKSLDLITITVPPALPATMSVGVAFAITRLKRSKIFCISPPRVNISGRISIMVFDKTGTLTEDGLQLLGVRGNTGDIQSTEINQFEDFAASISDLLPANYQQEIEKHLLLKEVILNEAMASCHSITYVNNQLLGDPLEIKMFESTNWELDEKNMVSNSSIATNDLILAFVRPSN
jgi:cation-transporting ATPase 13A2